MHIFVCKETGTVSKSEREGLTKMTFNEYNEFVKNVVLSIRDRVNLSVNKKMYEGVS